MSITKIDPESQEFQEELAKTLRFTDKVIKQFDWAYNPQEEVNEGVQMGLARNKMMYGKRFCPCFMVEVVDGVARSVDNRICPCKPAIEKEIPEEGSCHCGIFCSPEHAAEQAQVEEVVHRHSRGLTKEECELLLTHEQLDGDEVMALLEARELGMVDFQLIDVREHMEWMMGHIQGTDHLIPTSSFFQALQEARLPQETHLIVYCHVGSRSAHCQRILHDMGYKNVGNLTYGIVSYGGPIERG